MADLRLIVQGLAAFAIWWAVVYALFSIPV